LADAGRLSVRHRLPDLGQAAPSMAEWLHLATKEAVIVIDAMAFVIVALATAEAFVGGLLAAFPAATANARMRRVWLRFGRWLVAGLTFQLAADIIGTSVAPSWEEVGKLGAIAVIRTFLNFFLERDLAELRDPQATEPR
jgi:uncharacterized membrane protein